MQLDDTGVAGIAVRSDTDTDGGSPGDEPNDTVLDLAPPFLDLDEELLEVGDLGTRFSELGLVL